MSQLRYREAVRAAMIEEMDRDDRVYLIGEEVGHYQGAYKVSEGMLEKFGERRVIDTPIAEGGFAGIGVGFIGFSDVTIDAGASWNIAGYNTLGAGTSLVNSGTGELVGSLTVSGGAAVVGLSPAARGGFRRSPAGCSRWATPAMSGSWQ